MTNMIQKIAGLSGMTDQVIATDFLLATKTAIQNYTLAITESVTPEVRDTLKKQLTYSIEAHEKITQYMLEKGYFHPSDLKAQAEVAQKTTKATLKLAD